MRTHSPLALAVGQMKKWTVRASVFSTIPRNSATGKWQQIRKMSGSAPPTPSLARSHCIECPRALQGPCISESFVGLSGGSSAACVPLARFHRLQGCLLMTFAISCSALRCRALWRLGRMRWSAKTTNYWRFDFAVDPLKPHFSTKHFKDINVWQVRLLTDLVLLPKNRVVSRRLRRFFACVLEGIDTCCRASDIPKEAAVMHQGKD